MGKKKRANSPKKVLPKAILDIQNRLKKEGVNAKGFQINIETMSHSNGHNNHSDHTDAEKLLENLVNPVIRRL